MKKKKVKDRIEALDAFLDYHPFHVKELNDRLDSLAMGNSIVMKRCSNLETRIDTFVKRLDRYESNHLDDANLIDSMRGRLDEHDKRIEGIEEKDDKRDDQLEDHENRIITTESVINDIMSRLNEIEEKLNSMSARIDAIESKEEKTE